MTMGNTLYHDVIEIRHLPDNQLICMISSPYFDRHFLNKMIGNITKLSENFSVTSYQRKKESLPQFNLLNEKVLH